MGANQQKGNLPRYDDSAVVLMRGADINKIHAMLETWRPVAGANISLKVGPSGTTINGTPGGVAGELGCPLGGYKTDPDSTTTPPAVIINPGWLIAPNKSVMVVPGSVSPSAGSSVWVKCAWTSNVIDGVLVGGGDLGYVTVGGGSSVPANDIPTGNSPSGTAYVVLGGWDGDENWVSAGCGSISLDFCPGGFIISRGAE